MAAQYRGCVVVDGEVILERSFFLERDATRWLSKRGAIQYMWEQPSEIVVFDRSGDVVQRLAIEAA